MQPKLNYWSEHNSAAHKEEQRMVNEMGGSAFKTYGGWGIKYLRAFAGDWCWFRCSDLRVRQEQELSA